MTRKIVTANRLTDGRVVFMATETDWSERIADSYLADDDDASTLLLANAGKSVAGGVVVDPYLVDVTMDGALPRPIHFRERIRAGGPTIAARGRRDVA